jgi:DNA-binding MarR family transcriptional regulator
MTSRWDALTEEVVHLFAHVAERFNRDYEDAAAQFDLTPIQAKVLMLAEEPTPMHQIADRLGSERSNVTGIVDRLEARGLVQRQPDDRDRRIKNVVLTSAGHEAARNVQRELHFAAEPLAGLTVAERTQLRDLLRRL